MTIGYYFSLIYYMNLESPISLYQDLKERYMYPNTPSRRPPIDQKQDSSIPAHVKPKLVLVAFHPLSEAKETFL
jgi:hypothetical protein